MIRCLVLLSLFFSFPLHAEEEDFSASGFDRMRIEQEEKLFVPLEIADDVLAWLKKRYVDDRTRIAELDPAFTTYVHVEDFTDVYFDSPTLQLHASQSGVRHRTRFNLTDPDHEKSARQLMQIKVNNISANALERGEIKYRIEKRDGQGGDSDGHPMLGIVKLEDRAAFSSRLIALGLEPRSMRHILTVHDLRTRIYFNRGATPFMSISFDQVSSSLLWAETHFVEIEPELNEIGFTDADAETRKYMESILKQVVDEIRAQFPQIRSNLTPKYSKSFAALEAQIPVLRTLVRWNLHQTSRAGSVLIVALLALGLGGYLAYDRFAKRPRPNQPKADQPAAT